MGIGKGKDFRFSRLFLKALNFQRLIQRFLKKQSRKPVKTHIFFPPFRTERFSKNFCIASTYAKLHVQAKKSPFWIFHWVHDVSLSLPYCVKVRLQRSKFITTLGTVVGNPSVIHYKKLQNCNFFYFWFQTVAGPNNE